MTKAKISHIAYRLNNGQTIYFKPKGKPQWRYLKFFMAGDDPNDTSHHLTPSEAAKIIREDFAWGSAVFISLEFGDRGAYEAMIAREAASSRESRKAAVDEGFEKKRQRRLK